MFYGTFSTNRLYHALQPQSLHGDNHLVNSIKLDTSEDRVWQFPFYDIQPGNGLYLFFQHWSPHGPQVLEHTCSMKWNREKWVWNKRKRSNEKWLYIIKLSLSVPETAQTAECRCMLTNFWCKSFQLSNPVRNSWQWSTDEKWSWNVTSHEITDQSNTLNGLAKAHLISQNSIHSILIQHLHTQNKWLIK